MASPVKNENQEQEGKPENAADATMSSSSEDSDDEEEYPRVAGAVLKISKSGKSETRYYSSFDLRNTRYQLNDSVLLFSDEKGKKPFIGTIKEIFMPPESEVTLKVQWFYRPEECRVKDIKKVPSSARSLLYSFHSDVVSAASVFHKCVILVIPPIKKFPEELIFPGFVVQYIYDAKSKGLFPVTDKDFETRMQAEIDERLESCRSIWEPLPDVEVRKALEKGDQTQSRVTESVKRRRKAIISSESGPRKEEDERAENSSRDDVVILPADETEKLLLIWNGATNDKTRDKWRVLLLNAVAKFCKGTPAAWPEIAVRKVSALEEAAHSSLNTNPRKYNWKLRSIYLNLQISETLLAGIFSGDLSPSEIIQFQPEDLKEGKKVQRPQREKTPDQEVQRLGMRCVDCGERQVDVMSIMKSGLSSIYSVKCAGCGSEWSISQDSIANLSEVPMNKT